MKLILSPSTRELYTDFSGEGHKYYLLPTDDPCGDLVKLFGLPPTTVRERILPKVMVYRRPPKLDRPGVSVLPIITPDEMEKMPMELKGSIPAYFVAAQKRWRAEKIWERRRLQIISLFLRGNQVYDMVSQEGKLNLASAATILSSANLRTGAVIVKTKSPYPAMKIYTAVPKEEKSEKAETGEGETGGGKKAQRGEYWHISALPFSRPPIRVSPLRWEIGLAALGNGEGVALYASPQSVYGIWRSYCAAGEAEQEARTISKGISAAAGVYGKSFAVPITVAPYGFVVIRHMPPVTYEKRAPSATIKLMWTEEWKSKH